MEKKKRTLFLLTILSFAAVLLTWHINNPHRLYFDEIYYVPASKAINMGNPDPNWVAPPLGKILIGDSIQIFGNNPFSWRLPSVLASILSIYFFFLMTFNLFSKETNTTSFSPELTAFIASLFYLLDGMTYMQSRIGMLDMMMTGFLMGAFYFFLTERYLLCSIFMGLSLSCKWAGIFSVFFFLPLIPVSDGFKKYLAAIFKIYIPAFILYTAIFIFSAFGYKLFLFNSLGSIFAHFFQSQIKMLKFYLKPIGFQPYEAPWWKCLLLIRPIWYTYSQVSLTRIQGILMLPNLFIWWPALISCFFLFLKLSDKLARLILYGVFWIIIPWILSSRPGFIYYLLPISPFLILALIYWIRNSKIAAWLAFSIISLGFLLYYPLYSNLPITYPYFWSLIWLKSWI